MSVKLENKDLRLTFEVARKSIADSNKVPIDQVDTAQLTQGYIRSEATLTIASSTIQWPIIDTQQIAQSPITPTMRLLPQQDSFYIGQLGYWMMIYEYTNSSQQYPNFSSQNNWQPITFNSPWDNNGFGVDWEPGTMMLWLGYISIEVNKKVLIPYWDCLRHYYVPETQSTPNVANSAFIPKQKNQYDGGIDAIYPVEPNIVIGGGRDNIVKLNLPGNIPNISPFDTAGATPAGYVPKAVIMFRGIWAQNSTNVK